MSVLLAAIGRGAETEPMWITTPDPRSIMPGTKARSSRAGPTKLRSMSACQAASDTDSNPPGLGSPAAGVADQDVEPGPVGCQPTDNGLDARGGSDVGRDEQDAVHGVRGRRSRGCAAAGAGEPEAANDS